MTRCKANVNGFRGVAGLALSVLVAASMALPVWAEPGAAASDAPAGVAGKRFDHKGKGGPGKKGCHNCRQGGKGMSEAQRQAHHEKFVKELNLTPEQDAKLKALKGSHSKDFEAMKAKHNELRTLKQGNGDPAQIEALRGELKSMRTNLMAQKQAEMKSILTPEQVQKMESMRAERKQKWEAKRGEHRRHAPGAPVAQPQ